MPPKSTPKFIDSITVQEFFDSFREILKLRLLTGEKGMSGRIREKSVNRPSLVLTGYYKYFAAKRIQLFGAGEMSYMRDLSKKKQYQVLHEVADRHIPCIIVSRNLLPTGPMQEIAQKRNIPLMRTPLTSRDFTSMAVILLEEKFGG